MAVTRAIGGLKDLGRQINYQIEKKLGRLKMFAVLPQSSGRCNVTLCLLHTSVYAETMSQTASFSSFFKFNDSSLMRSLDLFKIESKLSLSGSGFSPWFSSFPLIGSGPGCSLVPGGSKISSLVLFLILFGPIWSA